MKKQTNLPPVLGLKALLEEINAPSALGDSIVSLSQQGDTPEKHREKRALFGVNVIQAILAHPKFGLFHASAKNEESDAPPHLRLHDEVDACVRDAFRCIQLCIQKPSLWQSVTFQEMPKSLEMALMGISTAYHVERKESRAKPDSHSFLVNDVSLYTMEALVSLMNIPYPLLEYFAFKESVLKARSVYMGNHLLPSPKEALARQLARREAFDAWLRGVLSQAALSFSAFPNHPLTLEEIPHD